MVFQTRLFQDPLAFCNLWSDTRRFQSHGDKAEVGDGVEFAGGVAR